MKEYIISDNVRNKLKTPLGTLIENKKINREYLLNIINSNQTITIGDATTEKFIKYNSNLNSINFSFIFGERQFDIYGINNEKYFDFVLGIEIGEKWFIRKK